MTVLVAIVIFVLLEITSGTLSTKYTTGENLREQFSLLLPFLFLYLLPTAFGSSWWRAVSGLGGTDFALPRPTYGQGLDLLGKTALPKPPTFKLGELRRGP
jgi:hypothetical protein